MLAGIEIDEVDTVGSSVLQVDAGLDGVGDTPGASLRETGLRSCGSRLPRSLSSRSTPI
jgi:hypothetical protein